MNSGGLPRCRHRRYYIFRHRARNYTPVIKLSLACFNEDESPAAKLSLPLSSLFHPVFDRPGFFSVFVWRHRECNERNETLESWMKIVSRATMLQLLYLKGHLPRVFFLNLPDLVFPLLFVLAGSTINCPANRKISSSFSERDESKQTAELLSAKQRGRKSYTCRGSQRVRSHLVSRANPKYRITTSSLYFLFASCVRAGPRPRAWTGE